METSRSTITTLQVFTRFNVSFEHAGHRILKVLWTYLHLRPLHRVVVVFPVEPAHSSGIDLSMKI